MEGLFLDLTLLLALATGLGLVMHLLRQPPLLGYIITGVLIGGIGILGREEQQVFRSLAEIGVALLLFMVGLEMRVQDLKTVGRASLVTGAGQIFFTTAIGLVLARAFGFSIIASFYLALAVAFSSTIIIVKLLSQKHDLDSLYGKVAVGFLLVQDFVAIMALVFLAGSAGLGGDTTYTDLAIVLAKAVVLFSSIVVLSQALMPYLINRLAKSQELLFIASLAWAFAVAAFTASPAIGFSIEIGGFLAGLALANSTEHFEIAGRVRPLRDFFIVLFFIMLGMQLGFGNLGEVWQPALVFSAFVLIGNPLIVLILMALLGFRRRTSFLAGLTVAQISEFSLILIALGIRLGHLPLEFLTLIALIAVVTMTISSYLILEGDRIFEALKPLLFPFQKSKTIEESLALHKVLRDHVVIIGGHRTAENILKVLEKKDTPLIVVDVDPRVVKTLSQQNIPVIFGDISDSDIREQASLEDAKMVISTMPDPVDTRRLLSSLKSGRKNTYIIVTAQEMDEAREFYKTGADYVLLPHFVSGEHIADIITDEQFTQRLKRLRIKHQARLAEKSSF
jgi:Kef-type K+ transport system membrane component KefB